MTDSGEQPDRRATCAATPRRAAAFLAGTLSPAELRDLRSHRATCPACDALWRESISAVSGLGGRARRERLDTDRVRRRADHRRRALEGAGVAGAPRAGRSHRARLRLVLLPALALFLMTVVWPLADRDIARLEVLAGEVELDGRPLHAADGRALVHRGTWCTTAAGSRARLTLGDTSVELAPGSRLLVEDPERGRFRLDAGELRLSGDCLVTSGWGVVRAAGAAGVVRTESGGLEIEVLAGVLTATDSRGHLTLEAGERGRLAVEPEPR